MNYTYSICHPEKPEIEYPKIELNNQEVIELIKNYSWYEILKKMEKIPEDELCFSPSVDIINKIDNRSLCITATMEKGKPEFSLWYNRPVTFRPLFGLLSERTRIRVIEKWGFNLDNALEYYQIFLEKKYEKLEKIMNEK
jgi:hypothetical protein